MINVAAAAAHHDDAARHDGVPEVEIGPILQQQDAAPEVGEPVDLGGRVQIPPHQLELLHGLLRELIETGRHYTKEVMDNLEGYSALQIRGAQEYQRFIARAAEYLETVEAA